MSLRRLPSAAFVRDSVVATLVLAIVLFLHEARLGPNVVQIPGWILRTPYWILSIVLGFQPPPGERPSLLFLGVYLLLLGMVVGWSAGVVRDADFPAGGRDWRVAIVLVLPAIVLELVLFYFGIFLRIVPKWIAAPLMALVGVGAVGVTVWYWRHGDSDPRTG